MESKTLLQITRGVDRGLFIRNREFLSKNMISYSNYRFFSKKSLKPEEVISNELFFYRDLSGFRRDLIKDFKLVCMGCIRDDNNLVDYDLRPIVDIRQNFIKTNIKGLYSFWKLINNSRSTKKLSIIAKYLIIDWLIESVVYTRVDKNKIKQDGLLTGSLDRNYMDSVLLDIINKYTYIGYINDEDFNKIQKASRRFILEARVVGLLNTKEIRLPNSNGSRVGVNSTVLIYFTVFDIKALDFSNFIIYSRSPYKPLQIRGRWYLIDDSFTTLRPIRIPSKTNRNLTETGVNSAISLSQTRISIDADSIDILNKELDLFLDELKTLVSPVFLENLGIDLDNADFTNLDIILKLSEENSILQGLIKEDIKYSQINNYDLETIKNLNKSLNNHIQKLLKILNNSVNKGIPRVNRKELEILLGYRKSKIPLGRDRRSYIRSLLDSDEIKLFLKSINVLSVDVLLNSYKESQLRFKKIDTDWRTTYDWPSYYNHVDVDKKVSLFRSKIINYYTIKWLMSNVGDGIYIPHTCDFRGRVYSNSLISPIYNKLIRPVIIIGDPISDKEKMLLEIEAKESKYYKALSDRYGISSYSEYLIFCIRLDIGKLDIKEIIKDGNATIDIGLIEEHGRSKISLLEQGKDPFSNWKSSDRIIAHILYKKYKLIINNQIPQYIPSLIDATASGQQVLTIILDSKEENLLQKLNIASTYEWTDTYLSILGDFKEYLLINDDLETLDIVNKYYTRNMVKRPIMTVFYNSTFFRVYKSMVNSFEIDQNIEKEDYSNLKKSIKVFYNFLTTKLISNNYKLDSLLFIKPIIPIDADLNYYETLSKQDIRYKITVDNKVITSSYTLNLNEFRIILEDNNLSEVSDKNIMDIMSFLNDYSVNRNDITDLGNRLAQIGPLKDGYNILELDKEDYVIIYNKSLRLAMIRCINNTKTRRAMAANLAHYIDAKIIASVLVRIDRKVYTIHDMYISDMRYRHYIYNSINYFFNEHLDKNHYSLTVVI